MGIWVGLNFSVLAPNRPEPALGRRSSQGNPPMRTSHLGDLQGFRAVVFERCQGLGEPASVLHFFLHITSVFCVCADTLSAVVVVLVVFVVDIAAYLV